MDMFYFWWWVECDNVCRLLMIGAPTSYEARLIAARHGRPIKEK